VDARSAAFRRGQSDFSHSVQMRPMIVSVVRAYSRQAGPFLSAALIYIACLKWFNAASAWVVATSAWPCLPSSIASFKCLIASVK
jgi:hypothetical protein